MLPLHHLMSVPWPLPDFAPLLPLLLLVHVPLQLAPRSVASAALGRALACPLPFLPITARVIAVHISPCLWDRRCCLARCWLCLVF